MIHIFIGTKAQFIKMAPIMQKLNEKRVAYNFIDSGQHAGITSDLIKQFGLRPPDVYLRNKNRKHPYDSTGSDVVNKKFISTCI